MVFPLASELGMPSMRANVNIRIVVVTLRSCSHQSHLGLYIHFVLLVLRATVGENRVSDWHPSKPPHPPAPVLRQRAKYMSRGKFRAEGSEHQLKLYS